MTLRAVLSRSIRKSSISEQNLLEALRINGQRSDPNDVKVASPERSGDISVLPRHREPWVAEVTVKAGIQTVHIKLR